MNMGGIGRQHALKKESNEHYLNTIWTTFLKTSAQVVKNMLQNAQVLETRFFFQKKVK